MEDEQVPMMLMDDPANADDADAHSDGSSGIEQDATPEGVARRVARVQSAEAREEARRVALSRTMQGVQQYYERCAKAAQKALEQEAHEARAFQVRKESLNARVRRDDGRGLHTVPDEV